ncbi:unnamed protein product [Echinostoma caproni]|uniref:Ectonucleotide pyrophosphatase/phosphodiesterase family member 5 n=1 Tax=Echinostoma caproni TaxID=27848 RepID=A0A183B7S2_9TREM|nr:unnamed protein product [Echinostoma caproni]
MSGCRSPLSRTCALLILLASCSAFILTEKPGKVLIISLDGFRHDYLELAKLAEINISAFKRIWNSGFRAMRVQNEFISRTGPNHFTIATGLHEESHGLVDNSFYDPHLNATFALTDTTQANDSRWFDVGAEPIWVTNERHGYRSAVNAWPGIYAKIKGSLPSYVYPNFNFSIPFRQSISWMIEQLQKPNTTLGMLYHNQPDIEGHNFGPYSHQVLRTIDLINQDLGYLLQQVDNIPSLSTDLNIIVTSDHGMVSVDRQRMIILDELIDQTNYTSPGPPVRVMWALWPKDGFTALDLYNRLVNKHLMLRVYLRENVPQNLYYSRSWRIAPVVLFAHPGWLIAQDEAAVASYDLAGDHGYSTDWPEVYPFFLAMGPEFRPHTGTKTIPLIHMVDIYPLVCHLIGLSDPAPNNGSLDRVLDLVQSRRSYFGSGADRFTGKYRNQRGCFST